MRVVVAIDPAMTSGDEADETGIIVAGKDKNGHGYVLADLSGRNPPIEGQHRAARDIDAGHGTKDYVGIRVPRKQTYTLSGLADLIEAGVRMVQPDVVKWAALPACGVVPLWRRHTASKVPHQTQPTIGHTANLHLVASLLHMTSLASGTTRRHASTRSSKIPPNQPTACSTYRPDPVSVYKSTRPS